jgi:hypothetical protein
MSCSSLLNYGTGAVKGKRGSSGSAPDQQNPKVLDEIANGLGTRWLDPPDRSLARSDHDQNGEVCVITGGAGAGWIRLG